MKFYIKVKKIFCNVLLVSFLISFFVFNNNQVLYGDKPNLKFSIGPWQPYFSEDRSKISEFEKKTKRFFESNFGFQLEFIYFDDWEEAKEQVLNQNCYATFPFRKTHNRTLKYEFSRYSILNDLGVLFCMRDLQPFYKLAIKNELENLMPFTIGFIEGYSCWRGEELRQLKYNNFKKFSDQESLFTALIKGEVDFASEDLIAGYEAISRMIEDNKFKFPYAENDFAFFPIYRELDIAVGIQPMFIMTRKSRGANPILKRIDSLLRKAHQDGSIFKVRDYGSEYVSEYLPYEIKINVYNSLSILKVENIDEKTTTKSEEILPPLGTKGIVIKWDNDSKLATVFITFGLHSGSVVEVPYSNFEILNRLSVEDVFGDYVSEY